MTRARRLLLVAAILLLAAGLRGLAVARLPVDFDEPVYYRGGLAYAAALRAGDVTAAADPAPEHPALVKLLYAAVLLPQGPPGAPATTIPPPALRWGRAASAVLGVGHVLLLAAVAPAAGALLAIHTYTVKYTAQIYLEALPMLTATVCVLAYARAARGDRRRVGWLVVSAVALGLTAAAKYIYVVAGLAVAADWLWAALAGQRPRQLAGLLGWGGLALLVFLAANPALWPAPLERLLVSLAFHAGYSQSAHVQQSGYPWYQPFVWLLVPLPARWHPGIIITPLDTLTALLGVAGARPLWRRGGRVIVLWWLAGLLFGLLWATKWPQYSLVMTAPMCLCAAEGARRLWPARRARPAHSVNQG